jgi:hypothetical protein
LDVALHRIEPSLGCLELTAHGVDLTLHPVTIVLQRALVPFILKGGELVLELGLVLLKDGLLLEQVVEAGL